MISIIIPAHNEEKVISATLKELGPGVISQELEVIVVCNGCTDNTSEIVSSFRPVIKCIQTPVASKSVALNLGDAAASGFPRFFLDADVVLTLDGIRKITHVLQSGACLAAAPKMKMDVSRASWPVKFYYDVWQTLPYVKEGMIGVGVYALSCTARKRFKFFPEIIADDGYIRSLFKKNERMCVSTCFSHVRAPENIKGLLKIKARSRLGVNELKEKFPELIQNEEKNYYKAMFDLLKNFSIWHKIPVYLYINFLARLLAENYKNSLGYTGWERDDSSRNIRS